jgi:hypothetical protein
MKILPPLMDLLMSNKEEVIRINKYHRKKNIYCID